MQGGEQGYQENSWSTQEKERKAHGASQQKMDITLTRDLRQHKPLSFSQKNTKNEPGALDRVYVRVYQLHVREWMCACICQNDV